MNCSAVTGSEVITRVSYSEIFNSRTSQSLTAASETELGLLGKALIFCQSKHEDSTVRLCGREKQLLFISLMSSTQRGHVSHPRERGAVTVCDASQLGNKSNLCLLGV